MRVLVLEDDPLVALELELIVAGEGHDVAGPYARARDAVADLDAVDFALLDVEVRDGVSFGLARALADSGVPFAFVSGSRRASVPESFAKAPFVRKPFPEAAIVAVLKDAERSRVPAKVAV